MTYTGSDGCDGNCFVRGTACSDGVCKLGKVGGVCVACVVAHDCADGNFCTVDSCEDNECVYTVRVGESCPGGVCDEDAQCVTDCAAGTADCDGDGSCDDLLSDDTHCGSCDNECSSLQECLNGLCVATCVADCSQGSCAGGVYTPCGDFDDDACLDWGLSVSCDDANDCTVDTCSVLDGCSHSFASVRVSCDDGELPAGGQCDGAG